MAPPATKAPVKAAAGAKAPKAAQPALVKPKAKKGALSPALRKLAVHPSTRPLLGKLRALAKKKKVDPASLLVKRPAFKVKPIGGEKNGKSRKVLVNKGPKFYPTEDRIRRRTTGHVTHKQHVRRFKAGIEPGRILIVLAGRHRGKRVVCLGTLPSGLLLVTGPFKINACPLRRMHQQFVIVTSTKLNLGAYKVPAHIDDKYFKVKKDKSARGKKSASGGDIFSKKKEAWSPDQRRKDDQIAVDKAVIDVVRKSGADKKILFSYLGSFFQLRNNMYPHKMKF